MSGTSPDPAGRTRTIVLSGSGNRTPTALPSSSGTPVTTGATVTLGGNGSDPDGDTITSYSWSLSAPPGSAATLLPNTSTRNPSFDTDVAGNYTATLTVSDGLASSSGIGVTVTANPPTPIYQATPSSVSDFSARINSGTQTRDITISNGAGATGTLTLSSIGLPSGPFTRDAASTCTNGTTLTTGAPGNQCLLRVRFTPTTAGPVTVNVTVAHNASGSPGTIVLSGAGTQSLFSPAATTLNFGGVQQGVPAPAQTVTVTNAGTATLNITADPRLPGAISGVGAADYSVTGGSCALGSVLAASGGSCTLIVGFTPSVTGVRDAELQVVADATNGPLRVTLQASGVALPEPAVVVTGGAFGNVVIGQSSAPTTATVTITNTRTRAVNYTLPTLADFAPTVYSPIGCAAAGGTGSVAGGGGTCAISYVFQPTAGPGEGPRDVGFNLTFTGTLGDVAPTPKPGAFTGTALLPLLVPPGALAFSTTIGTPQLRSTLLTNRSNATLTLTSVTIGGAAALEYAFDATHTCNTNRALAAGSTCVLAVRFDPTTVGQRDALVTVVHGAAGSPQTVSLSGQAAPRPQGRLELSALSLAFGDTQLNATTTRTITLQNAGNLALNFLSFPISGAAPGDFQTGGTCSVAAPLAVAATCTLSVTFAPGALGARSATLSINSDGSNATPAIGLTGNGVPVPAPRVSFAPITDPLDFGNQTVGGAYPAQAVRIVNSGTADLVISAVAVEGAAFADAGTGSCAVTLAPAAGCDVNLRFTPATIGRLTGALKVTSNVAGSPQSLGLVGTGVAFTVPVLRWQPAVSELDFGNVSVGNVSGTLSATLLNEGPSGVTLGLLNAVGVDAALFSVSGGTCTSGLQLFAGDSCSVEVRFVPTVAGLRSATVQVASNGSVPPTLQIKGTGLGGPAPDVALSSTTLTFADARVGAPPAPLDVTLTSTGAGGLRVSGLEVTGPFRLQSKTCPALPFTLAPGSACTLSVTYTAQAEGAGNGRLTVTTDAASGATREVTLNGRADAMPETSSGGCSIARGNRATDPTLWLLLLAAVAALLRRRRVRRRRA